MMDIAGLEAILKSALVFNNIVCCLVAAFGFYWLHFFERKWRDEYRFLYRAYTCWWFSWLAWVASWILINSERLFSKDIKHIIALAFTDIHATFLILVYFNLTRANEFRKIDALYISGIIVLALCLVFGLLYVYMPDRNYAYDIHKSVALCIGFVTTLVLGWAFALRYNTNIVLVVGYVYGFLQPVAYKAAFFTNEDFKLSPALFITVIVVLAFMKVVWATVVTWFFMQKPESTKNLVSQSKSGLRSKLFQGRVGALEIQTLVLLGAFTLFLLLRVQDFTSKVLGAITQLLAVFGILMGAVSLWNRLNSKAK